jgi:hypothetical protein
MNLFDFHIYLYKRKSAASSLATDGCKERRETRLSAGEAVCDRSAQLDFDLLDCAFVDLQLVIVSGFDDAGEAARPIATGIDAFEVVSSAIIGSLEKLVRGIVGIPENRDRHHTGIFQAAGKALDGIGIVGAGHVFSGALTATKIDRLNLADCGEVLGRGAIANLELTT